MFNDFDNEVVLCVKPFFLLLSSGLFACGIGELVSSIVVISDSGGYYIGGIYVGAIAIAAGLTGFRISHKKSLFGCIVLFTISLIASIVSSALQASMISYVEDIEACSSYDSSSTSTTCNAIGSYYRCYGNDDYFGYAQTCEASYVYNYGTGDQSCSCIQQDSSTCYTFTNVPSCERFTNDLPSALRASYSFAIIVVILSAALIVISVFSYGCFQRNTTTNTQTGSGPAPTIVYATSSPIVVTGTVPPQGKNSV